MTRGSMLCGEDSAAVVAVVNALSEGVGIQQEEPFIDFIGDNSYVMEE